MKSKQNIKLFFLVVFIGMIVVMSINYIIDPLQHYNKASFYKPYPLNQRYMNWGLIKNYEYDTVLTGSSMTENFKVSEIDNILGVKSLKIPFSSITSYEMYELLNYTINQEKVKTIIIGLDLFSFNGEKNRSPISLPKYLYNNTVFDDYKYLLNFDVLYEMNTKVILANHLGIKRNRLDYNKFWYWGDDVVFGKDVAISSYQSSLHTFNKIKTDFKTRRDNFDSSLFKLIKENQDIKFKIFYPPYSMLTYKLLEKQNKLDSFIDFKKYIFKSLIYLKNVNQYDFQIEDSITFDLDLYKDINHYHPKVNTWMLEQISQNKYFVNSDNYEVYLQKLNKQIDSFEVKDMYE